VIKLEKNKNEFISWNDFKKIESSYIEPEITDITAVLDCIFVNEDFFNEYFPNDKSQVKEKDDFEFTNKDMNRFYNILTSTSRYKNTYFANLLKSHTPEVIEFINSLRNK
jgi:hypothetical protein